MNLKIHGSPPILSRWTACLAVLSLCGCVVPLPAGHIPSREFVRNVDEQSMLAVTIGRTSRREILLNLGQPDFVMDDERTFIYLADATEGGYTWLLLYALPAGAEAVVGAIDDISPPLSQEQYRLTVRFDEQGLVKDHKFERAKQK